jgi:preprotein translocase subunit SecD
MKTLSSWLLGGALAASLTWNWTNLRDAGAAQAGPDCAQECELGLELAGGSRITLSADKKAALDELCSRSCSESDRLERRADELQRELLASLSAESVDEAAADALVAEIAELRRRSLSSCVEGILGVRSVLSGAEVRALLERCEHTSCK